MVHQELRDALVLVFANKCDMPTARNVNELIEIYGFNEVRDHEWQIQPCCALTGEGLSEGLDWLSDRLSERVKKGFKGTEGMAVTKMPDNENRANLTNLTIRTSQFFSERGDKPSGGSIMDLEDLENGGSHFERSIKKSAA